MTISFGLRNMRGPGPRCASWPGSPGRAAGWWCASSAADESAFRRVYLGYLMRALPAVARRVSSNPEAYVYLAESIRLAGPAGLAEVGAGRVAAGAWRN